MSALQDRISATLIDYWPAPWYGSEKQHAEVKDLADAIIAELRTPLHGQPASAAREDEW